MSDTFDWEISEDDQPFDPQQEPDNGRFRWWSLLFAVLIVGVIAVGWFRLRDDVQQQEQTTETAVQAVLNREKAAYNEGNGERFFALNLADPAWQSALLQPVNQLVYAGNPHITNLHTNEDRIWANVAWDANGQTYQRVMFFREEHGTAVHLPTDFNYWHRNTLRQETDWGALRYNELDETYAPAIVEFVTANLPANAPPVVVELRTDYGQSAEPGEIHLPSPRLVALDSAGQPADLFWEMLDQRLSSLQSTTIRFAIPERMEQLVDYERFAARFMHDNPDITIELIVVDTLTPTWSDLQSADGAAFMPQTAWLTAGYVYDLTDLMQTDPTFDESDFYEQIWQGGWWRDRLWMLPQAADMPVIYYDEAAYEAAQRSWPQLQWSWQEMAQDMTAVSQPESPLRWQWGFLDPGNDALFSYAFNQQTDCAGQIPAQCAGTLSETAVVSALEWYAGMAGQPGQMPNLLEVPPAEAEHLLMNWQSARRKAVIWVDNPQDYEFRLLLAPLGVSTFPGSDRFDGVTPLHVHGHFISQQAENPLAVWRWLTYLSEQPLNSHKRFIPARPSVAEQTLFWRILPRELGNVMRTAFSFARPITIAEMRYFTPEQITAVLDQTATPAEALPIQPSVQWFSKEE